MPYEIKRRGSKYEVVNTSTGEGHGPTTKAKAERQLRLLRGIERDWEPTGKPNTYKRGNQTLHLTGGKGGKAKR